MTKEKEPLNLSAYYYGFDKTGVREVDELLAAVAHAGKCFHDTADWTGPTWSDDDTERPTGPSVAKQIQAAADRLAYHIDDLRDEITMTAMGDDW